jgi:hypothetical protein
MSIAEVVCKTLTGKSFPLTLNEDDTGLMIKKKIGQVQGIPVDQLRVIFQGKQIGNKETVKELGIHIGATLHIVLRLGGPSETDVYYKYYISTCSLSHFEKDVVCTPTIVIGFKENENEKTIPLKVFPSLYNVYQSTFSNIWHNYLSPENLERFNWTEATYVERAMILELSEEFLTVLNTQGEQQMMEYLNSVRYHIGGPGSYYGGDVRTWQRYTTKLPLPVNIEVLSKFELMVSTKPQIKLQPNTWYVFALLHTMSIVDDYLIPFKTGSE